MNLNGPDDGLQINQNWIRKQIDEVEEDDDDEAIADGIMGLETKLKNNKAF